MSLFDSFPNRDSLRVANPPVMDAVRETASAARHAAQLGKREREVLEIVWADGSGTVGQVSRRLPISLAYTTVMTTLDRLFKKGLLRRVKRDRAFLYSPAVSPVEVDSLRARTFIQRFFEGRGSRADVLLSCLVDAIGQYDDEMLQRLEEQVQAAKLQLQERSKSQELVQNQADGPS